MRDITTLFDTPLNRLFFAINHYISTGDKIGEGISAPEGPQKNNTGEPHPSDRIRLLVLVNLTLPQDQKDFETFKAKFSQIADRFHTKLENMGKQKHFQVYSFLITYGFADDMAKALTEEPGPLGWGSIKEEIDKHFPG